MMVTARYRVSRWYFAGTEKWEGDPHSEKGCIGCPWHNVILWKENLLEAVN